MIITYVCTVIDAYRTYIRMYACTVSCVYIRICTHMHIRTYVCENVLYICVGYKNCIHYAGWPETTTVVCVIVVVMCTVFLQAVYFGVDLFTNTLMYLYIQQQSHKAGCLAGTGTL